MSAGGADEHFLVPPDQVDYFLEGSRRSEIHERHEGHCDHVLVNPQIQTFAVRRYVIALAVSSRMER
jgi:hypothetical protein